MTKVFWRTIKRNGEITIEYWTKEDKSDSIKEKFAVLNDERLKERYACRTGNRMFELVEVYEKK